MCVCVRAAGGQGVDRWCGLPSLRHPLGDVLWRWPGEAVGLRHRVLRRDVQRPQPGSVGRGVPPQRGLPGQLLHGQDVQAVGPQQVCVHAVFM